VARRTPVTTMFALFAAGLLLAAAPAVEPAAEEDRAAFVDHEVLLETQRPFAHVEGSDVVAVNPTGFTELGDAPRCSRDVTAYCETIRVEVRLPPRSGEAIGVADVTITLDAKVVGADHDIHVYATDPAGEQRVQRIARSGNVAGCQVDCTAQGLVVNEDQQPCVQVDECVTWRLVTEPGSMVRHYLVDIVYFAATSGYVADVELAVIDPKDA
jgi:hypothetical protein